MKRYPFHTKEKRNLLIFAFVDIIFLVLSLMFLQPLLIFSSIAYYFITNNGKAERMKNRSNKRA